MDRLRAGGKGHRLPLIPLDPHFPLSFGDGEGDVGAIPFAVAVEDVHDIVAGYRIAGDAVQPDLVFIVVGAQCALVGTLRDAAHAVADRQLLAILEHGDKVAALGLTAINAAMDKDELDLDLAAAIGGKFWPFAQFKFTAVATDGGTRIRCWGGRGDLGGRGGRWWCCRWRRCWGGGWCGGQGWRCNVGGYRHGSRIFDLRQFAKDPALLPINTADLPPVAGFILGDDLKALVGFGAADQTKGCARAAPHIDRLLLDGQLGLGRGGGRRCARGDRRAFRYRRRCGERRRLCNGRRGGLDGGHRDGGRRIGWRWWGCRRLGGGGGKGGNQGA